MPSILSHPAVPLALATLLPESAATPRVIALGVLCSILPDFDVIGFAFGVRYSDLLGHRGLTHSVFFALVLGAALTLLAVPAEGGSRWAVFAYLFAATVSHPLLDAMTTGGLGVALWAPFSNERIFFGFRPIAVSPIGIARFFSASGVRVLLSELLWIWLPCGVLAGGSYLLRRR